MTEENEMVTASQTIDQPTLPPAGDADSLSGVEPATSAAEIISQKTPRESCGLGSPEPSLHDPLAVMQEFQALDKDAYDKADELAGEYQKLMGRFDDELLPLADRMQSLLSQRGLMHVNGMPSWTEWRDKFIHYLQKNMKSKRLAIPSGQWMSGVRR